MRYLYILPFLILSCQANKSILSISNIFSKGMVLQRDTNVSFWGKSSPNQTIRLQVDWGYDTLTTSDSKGDWATYLKTPEAGGPYTINILCNNDTLIIDDVMIGEVWLASGQSNMEMPLKGWLPNDPILNSVEEISDAVYPNIRMFTVEKNFSNRPVEYLKGKWESANNETAGNFSATAYFFALRLYKELNIPIGIIQSSWGGTPAEAWTSETKLRDLGFFINILDNIKSTQIEKESNKWFHQYSNIKVPINSSQWEELNFLDSIIIDAELDDSNWDTTILPGRFDNLVSEKFDGVFWFRKSFEIKNLKTDYHLRIGAIDDMDKTFVNGINIGGLLGHGFFNTPREMIIPSSILKKGINTIAICAVDIGGEGRIKGPIQLSNISGELLSIEGQWKYKPIAEIYKGKFFIYNLDTDFLKRPIHLNVNQRFPNVLFNGMISPIIPYGIKGVIWYQGESNVGRHDQYKYLFPGMIEDWRNKWGKNFPFYFVQIAPFDYNSGKQISQKLRDSQRQALKIPNTGMVVTLDIGEMNNIHPQNKQDVGKRLAGLALSNDYGFNLVSSGPLFSDYEIFQDTIKINFNHIGLGLVIKRNTSNGFEIAASDKKYQIASVIVNYDHLLVYSKNLKTPKYVRYAWSDTATATLFNLNGLPASSFTTE